MHNSTNRFIYEVFFEVCLCSMIAVANDAYNDKLQSLATLIGVRLISWPMTILILCIIFACYVVAHYWTSLFKYFRNDKLPIFVKEMLTGMYYRHLWWLGPILAKTGVCLDKCFTPLGRCCTKLNDKLFGRCRAKCARLCPSGGGEKKKKPKSVSHSDTLRLDVNNKEHTEVTTTTVRTKNGQELSRTTVHDESEAAGQDVKR